MGKYTEIKHQWRNKSNKLDGYSACCMDMVAAGMDWLDEHPDANLSFSTYQNIAGVTTDETDDMKAVQDYMCDVGSGGDCTGYMMQWSSGGLLRAKEIGWDAFVDSVLKANSK